LQKDIFSDEHNTSQDIFFHLLLEFVQFALD